MINEQSPHPLNTILQGDSLSVLRSLPDNYVQCVVTSPPYYGLRDYGIEGQIGLEETPEEYVEKLVQVFREVRRTLKDNGVLWLNLGDSYASSTKGSTTDGSSSGLRRDGRTEESRIKSAMLTISHQVFEPRKINPGVPTKNLLGIPWRVAFALQADGWILRSDVIWHKPTAMPESVTDRPTTAHEHIFLLAKSERYFYDAEAIKEPSVSGHSSGNGFKRNARLSYLNTNGTPRGNDQEWKETSERNRRSVWTVATQPFEGAHFATFPPKLVEPCILAGTSPRTCEHCGTPWQRIIVPTGHINKREPAHAPHSTPTKTDSTGWAHTKRATDQWQPNCKCPNNTGSGKGIVLDPFMGSGTVAMVALQHNRNYLGIELNPDYITLAQKRIAVIQPNLWSTMESDGGAA